MEVEDYLKQLEELGINRGQLEMGFVNFDSHRSKEHSTRRDEPAHPLGDKNDCAKTIILRDHICGNP